jgi:hypothetical protein
MPWTEYFWHFDKFPYGGQDFELSVLLIVTIFGLVLVLLLHCKKSVIFIFALRRWLSPVFQDAGSAVPDSFASLFAVLHAPPLPSPALSMYNLPTQV